MLSEGLGNLLAAIIRKQQENEAMEQFQSLLQQTQKRVPVSGMGMDAIMRNEPLRFETQQDWDALTSAAAPNPMLMKLLIPFMQVKGMMQPKYQFINQERGGLQLATQPFGGKPTVEQVIKPEPEGFTLGSGQVRYVGGKPVAMGMPEEKKEPAPTELSKYFEELNRIRAENPKDPRIPAYEAVIKRLQVGVPYYQLSPDATGENLVWNPKEGRFERGTGVYKPTPEETKRTYGALINNLGSIKEIRDIVNKASTTGPISGRAKKLGARFFSDRDAQKLINTVGQLRTIIYGMSGKQINEQEQEWLDKEILPKIEQPDENFDVAVDILENWLSRQAETMEKLSPSLKKLGVRGANGGAGGDNRAQPNEQDFKNWLKTRK